MSDRQQPYTLKSAMKKQSDRGRRSFDSDMEEQATSSRLHDEVEFEDTYVTRPCAPNSCNDMQQCGNVSQDDPTINQLRMRQTKRIQFNYVTKVYNIHGDVVDKKIQDCEGAYIGASEGQPCTSGAPLDTRMNREKATDFSQSDDTYVKQPHGGDGSENIIESQQTSGREERDGRGKFLPAHSGLLQRSFAQQPHKGHHEDNIDPKIGECISEIHRKLLGTKTIELELSGLEEPNEDGMVLPNMVTATKKQMIDICELDETYLPEENSFVTLPWELDEVDEQNIVCGDDGIAIVGPGGAGKSTLLKKFGKDVVQGRIENCKMIKLTLYIELKHLEGDEECEIEDVLLPASTSGTLEPEQKKIMVTWMNRNSTNLMICFDGYDQLSRPISKIEEVPKDCFRRAKTNQFLRGILNKTLFPGALVLLSTREYALQHLPYDCIPPRIVRLVGLSDDNIDTLVLAMSNAEVLEKIKKGDMLVYIMASSPLFLTFVVYAKKCMGKNPPETKSGILMCIILNFISSNEHIRGGTVENLFKLASLALFGIVKKKIVFTEQEVRDHDLNLEDLKDMMIGIPRKTGGIGSKVRIMAGEYRRYFQHQSIQEQLAALNIIARPPREFERILKEISGNWGEVEEYVYGLLFRSENQKMLQDIATEIKNKLGDTDTQPLIRSPPSDAPQPLRKIPRLSNEQDHHGIPELGALDPQEALNKIISESKLKARDQIKALEDLSQHRKIALERLKVLLRNGCVSDSHMMRLLYESGDAVFIQNNVKKVELTRKNKFEYFIVGKILEKTKQISELIMESTSHELIDVLWESSGGKIPFIENLKIVFSKRNDVSNIGRANFAKICNKAKKLELINCIINVEGFNAFEKNTEFTEFELVGAQITVQNFDDWDSFASRVKGKLKLQHVVVFDETAHRRYRFKNYTMEDVHYESCSDSD